MIAMIFSCRQRPNEARAVLEQYRKYKDDWKLDKAYRYLADTIKNEISEQGFSAYYDKFDSASRNTLFETTFFKEIPLYDTLGKYKKFEVGYTYNSSEGSRNINGSWHYTLIKQGNGWGILWTESLIKEAGNYFSSGNYKKAIDSYQQVLSLNPYESIAFRGIITCYLRINQVRKAIEYAEMLVKLMPEKEDNFKILADVYGYTGQYSKAINIYFKALEVSKNPLYYISLGNSYKALEKYDSASWSYNKAIEADSDATQAYWSIAELYFNNTDNLDSALVYYKIASEKPPMSSEYQKRLYHGYAVALGNKAFYGMETSIPEEKIKTYQKARQFIDKALKIDPGNDIYLAVKNRIEQDLSKLNSQ